MRTSYTLRRPSRAMLRKVLPALLLLATTLGVSACSSPSQGTALPRLTVGLTYYPDIQFAPFYVADALGYYKDAGISVSFHHGIENDEFALLAAGKEDTIFAGGDEVLEARSASGLPLVDVATIFQKYPVALIVPADSTIHSLSDLKGHTIGVPGRYGATYTGLLALLQSAHLSTTDVQIETIGFTQVAALLTHKVDAVMGYSNNEPIQLQAQGFAIRTFNVWDAQPLVSNGIVALQSELTKNPTEVRALISATLRGVQYVIAHPSDAVRISAAYVPGLSAANKQASALAVLQATIPIMEGTSKPGFNDPATWQSMDTFLAQVNLIKQPVTVTQAYSNSYLPS
jgi:NitT/TauT family transport system substrate-binding protein